MQESAELTVPDVLKKTVLHKGVGIAAGNDDLAIDGDFIPENRYVCARDED